MSERQPNNRERGHFQDMHDAVEIAFWGVDFTPCDVATLPFRAKNQNDILYAEERTARGYDAERRSAVDVHQVRCDLRQGDIVTPENLVFIRWRDSYTVMLDLREDNIGVFTTENILETALDGQALKRTAKIGLASVDSIFG